MRRSLRDLSPVDVTRITQRAVLVSAEYERTHDLNDDDKMTLKILSVMAIAGDLLAGNNNN